MKDHRIIATDWQVKAAEAKQLTAIILPLTGGWFVGDPAGWPDVETLEVGFNVGDRVYLAEEWASCDYNNFVKSTTPEAEILGWQPAETMPPETASHWYAVTGVRVCQLSTLNPSDYVNCGMFLNMDKISGPWDLLQECRASEERWNAAHPDYPWKSDRHVVVLAMEAIAQ